MMARLRLLSSLTLALALPACGDHTAPTEPDTAGDLEHPAAALAAPSNTWTPLAPMPGPRFEFAVGMAPNSAGQSIVYVLGGRDENGTGLGGLAYNVATNRWGPAAGALIGAGSLNGVGKIGSKLYLTGGQSCCDEFFRTFNTTWAYEPATGRLLQKADMPRATRSGVTGVIGGKLYVLPGYCTGETDSPGHCAVGGPVRRLYRYDPSTNTWTARRQAPHFHTNGAAGVIRDKLYVVGGGSTNLGHLDVYDPSTNTWRTRAPIPTPGERLFAAVLQEQLFVPSWSHPVGGPEVLKAYAYDPATNTWKERAAPPFAGPLVRVTVGGQIRLLLVGALGTYLYTP